MVTQGTIGRRLPILLLVLVAWFSLTSAAFAVVVNGAGNAIITGLIGVAAIAVAIHGRFIKAAESRPLNGGALTIIFLVAVAVIVFEYSNLRSWDLVLLGEVYAPSVIIMVKAIGSILLSFGILLELLRIIRPRS